MNVAISSTPVSTGKAATTTVSSSSGASSGNGFAGALVQAIDGGNNAAAVSAGLSLPVGLVGLLGQLGAESTEDQTQDLLEMLANLMEQLQQLEQVDTLPQEAEDQLAALLTAFQGLLQQLGESQPAVTAEQTEILVSAQAAERVDVPVSKPVVQALRETLQQLSTVIAAGKDGVELTSTFANQLKALLDSLAPQPYVAAPSGQVVTDEAKAASTVIKAEIDSEQSVTVPKEALNQTAATVIQENRRPVQALREPIWRFSNESSTIITASDSQTAIVPSVAAAEESGNSNSQPAWTFMQNDTLANAETTAGKTTLPAQVPVQQFAEQMEKFLVKQFILTQGNGISEAKLTLNPEHLGQVDIRIVMHNGQLTAQFMTDNAMARDILENQMSQLRTALNGQGLQIEKIEVVQQPVSSSNASFMQQEHRQSNSGNNGNGSNGRGKNGSYEDPAVFAAELERTSFLREFGYGSSLNVTA